MNEIKNVAILGAGAIGAYFASRFFDTAGFSTVLLDQGERLTRLQKHGLVVNGKPYAIDSVDPEQVDAPMDLVVVALKHQHLEDAFQHLDKLVGESTIFISMMNGLESEEYIGSIYGMEKVLYAIVIALDAQRTDNQITYSNPGIHYFGAANNRAPDNNVIRVQHAFDRAGIKYETPGDMMRMMWWKFMINVGINQASAVLGAPYRVFQNSRQAQQLKESLMEEVIALAQAKNVNLSRKDIDDWYPVLQSLAPEGKTSMLPDVESGRKAEVEIFGGAVVRPGQELGVETPVNQALLRIIQVMEQAKQ